MNFGFFAMGEIPHESPSRKLDNSVRATEMPYGYDVDPYISRMGDQDLDKDYGKKERNVKKKIG